MHAVLSFEVTPSTYFAYFFNVDKHQALTATEGLPSFDIKLLVLYVALMVKVNYWA